MASLSSPRSCRTVPPYMLTKPRIGTRCTPSFKRTVIWSVMREVLLLLGIGLAIGLPAAFALGRFVSTQLFGIQPRDPSIAIWTMLLLTLVSSAAGVIPARRASRIDPILALRYE